MTPRLPSVVLPRHPWLRRSIPLAAALAAGGLTFLAYRLPPPSLSDFQQFWIGARALLRGEDPYVAVARAWPWPLFYPLPAVLLAFPVSGLSLEAARVAWAMLSAALFALACQRTARPLWIGGLSASGLQGIVMGQWSPLLTAAAVLPWLGFVWVAKPTVGLACFAGWPRRQAVIGSGLLVLLSLAIMPTWPLVLWRVHGQAIHRAPILRPGGVLLLLAWLRWRTPEGRLLGALACVPHSLAIFEVLPLFLIPRTRPHAYVLALLTYVAVFVSGASTASAGLTADLDRRWPVMFLCCYLPALAMVLWPRAPR